jgi:hypothetical protein
MSLKQHQSGGFHESPYFGIFDCVMLGSIARLRKRRRRSEQFYHAGQAEVTVGPNGISIGERGRDRDRVRDHDRFDRDHDRGRARLGDRDSDRGCRTVTVQERGETRTTRRCD